MSGTSRLKTAFFSLISTWCSAARNTISLQHLPLKSLPLCSTTGCANDIQRSNDSCSWGQYSSVFGSTIPAKWSWRTACPEVSPRPRHEHLYWRRPQRSTRAGPEKWNWPPSAEFRVPWCPDCAVHRRPRSCSPPAERYIPTRPWWTLTEVWRTTMRMG